MGQGSYVICEWDSVQREYPSFQQAFIDLESRVMSKCSLDWGKNFDPTNTFSGDGYNRTTILPGAFDDHLGVPMATYRQFFTGNPADPNYAVGYINPIMAGSGGGNIIPEGIKIALMGFAFPNKNQHITEIKMQISDTKYGRYHLEDMLIMNKPALIFEEGYVLDENEAFDLYAYLEGPIPYAPPFIMGIYQRMVPIGALYYSGYQKVGGVVGSQIPST